MAAKIINEIDSYHSRYHFKIGLISILFFVSFFFVLKNFYKSNDIPFIATFNYVEGVNKNTEVQIAGFKIGNISKISFSSDNVTINGYINSNYNIPKDSIIKIKSDGIFGKKALSIEPGFGDYFDKSNKKYVFEQTQDSYSLDMFLRYLNELNE